MRALSTNKPNLKAYYKKLFPKYDLTDINCLFKFDVKIIYGR